MNYGAHTESEKHTYTIELLLILNKVVHCNLINWSYRNGTAQFIGMNDKIPPIRHLVPHNKSQSAENILCFSSSQGAHLIQIHSYHTTSFCTRSKATFIALPDINNKITFRAMNWTYSTNWNWSWNSTRKSHTHTIILRSGFLSGNGFSSVNY